MPATRGDVTLHNVDGASVHGQVEQLKIMLREMMPDDSAEANHLRNTIKLLSDIERQLAHKGVATRH
ncbi:MAG: hypothetical protein ACOY3X_12640 [Pseudomonadota bacterium]